jgi:hypothetical protein
MMQKASKNRYEPLENLEEEIINSKESTEEIQSQQDPDPDPPSKKNESVFISTHGPLPRPRG